MTAELVHLERNDDGVAVVTLDNPKVNALSAEVRTQLRAVAERFPEICAAEEKFLQRVLAASVERRQHIVSGCNTCEYAITFDAPAARPDAGDTA